ncbi:hypothetical protein [Frondihabitans sp. VKM Ac-2883]|uniref:Ig-like domain-containing protein n=1 Tax=Frondihabitans sp. VKM Ac-2883 TaxID=2783823 RepID=UPI00188BEF65|nr:hypothetical protein [Frondihabitans sp. VKM Ac-2883]MBF4575768.1 hypothetical protein [Frondihabitans sp. VKM Ac-2883]
MYDRTASLKGYAKPGSLVQVTGGTTNKSARADADTGEWTMNVRNLDLGANKFSLESFDDANESLGTSEFTVDVKTTPLSASVKSTSLAAQTAEVEITGTPGLTVQYQNKTKTLGHDGTATVTVDGLSLGKNTVTFQQFEGGQQVEADLDFDIMVTINKITAEAAFDTRGTAFDAVLSGTAEANAKVTIVDGKGKVTTTYANPRGAWTTPVKAPDSGRQTFEVTQSINSSDGGSTDVTLDYGNGVEVTAPRNDSDFAGGTLTFRGDGQYQAGVEIFEKGNDTALASTVGLNNGTWAAQVAGVDGELKHTYTVVQKSKGNLTTSETVVVNGDKPETPPAGTEVVLTNPAKASDGYVPNQAFTFRGTAKPEATITIQNTKGLVFGTATANATTGEWAFTYANMKEYTYSLDFIADKGTTTEKKTELRNFAPKEATGTEVVLTNPANASDGYVPNQAFTFRGTAKPEATITIQNTKGLVFGTATANATTGEWAFTYANMKEYTYSLDFIADKGTTTEKKTELRNFAPNQMSTSLTNPANPSDGYAKNQSFTFTGTAKTGATVTIQNTKGLVFGTAKATVAGVWEFTVANMKDYVYSLDFIADKGGQNEETVELRGFAPRP